MTNPRIALISATPAAIGPAVAGLADRFPEALPWNLLDDRLMGDADDRGGLVPELAGRMRRLIGYAVDGGADGVLLTCSLYGPVTGEVDLAVPVLPPDAAAFAEVRAGRYRRTLVLASFETALRDSVSRLRAEITVEGEVAGAVAPGALEAAGDPTRLFAALLSAARPHADQVDAVLLAQYSLSPAAAELATALGLPVITGPHSAASALRTSLYGGAA